MSCPGLSTASAGTSGCAGAAPLLSNKTNLAIAAGNYATEAYQAGLVRFILFNQEVQKQSYKLADSDSRALMEITGVSKATLLSRID